MGRVTWQAEPDPCVSDKQQPSRLSHLGKEQRLSLGTWPLQPCCPQAARLAPAAAVRAAILSQWPIEGRLGWDPGDPTQPVGTAGGVADTSSGDRMTPISSSVNRV